MYVACQNLLVVLHLSESYQSTSMTFYVTRPARGFNVIISSSSLISSGAKLWNSLPADMRDSDTLPTFINAIDAYNL